MKHSIIKIVVFITWCVPAFAAPVSMEKKGASTTSEKTPSPPAGKTGSPAEKIPSFGEKTVAEKTAQAPALPGKAADKEYYGTKVLLVDAKAGLLGVLYTDEAGKSEKLSFHVDPDSVDITNKTNKGLEFSDLFVGASVDLYTIIGPDGKETVDQIIAYDVYPPD